MTDSERQTVERVIDTLLSAGFSLGVNDGEDITVNYSTDKAQVMQALHTTDEDYLIVNPQDGSTKPARFGWVRFVWGNEPWVAICDHTTNLESVLKPVFDWMEEQQDVETWKEMHSGSSGPHVSGLSIPGNG